MISAVETERKNTPYIDHLSFEDYLTFIEQTFPELRQMLDGELLSPEFIESYISEMKKISWEFERTDGGGRGDTYNLAQKDLNNRRVGMSILMQQFEANRSNGKYVILDALAGDGTIARFVEKNGFDNLQIISADLAGFMVRQCIEQKLPCIRQSATQSLFLDNSLDGVLIAYGSHHIPKGERKQAVAEAYRTLREGGRFVLHDFEDESGTAKWFEDVVHPFSRTGHPHPHPHFSRADMFLLLADAGFRDVRIFDMDDSFTLSGSSPEGAKRRALQHLYHMYDLVKISNRQEDALKRLEACVAETFGEIKIKKEVDCYTATVRRTALVAVGTKLERIGEHNLSVAPEGII
jgi:SAM-dependent methyltransferase